MRNRLMVVAALLPLTMAGTALADSVYLIANGGNIRRIDNGGVIGATYTDANTNFSRIAVGNATATGGLQVGVGDSTGGVHVMNAGLTSQTGFIDINGAGTEPVTAIAVGSIGSQTHAIAATHLWYDGAVGVANLRGRAFIYDSINPAALSQVGSAINANPGAPNGVFFPNGTPRTYVDAAIGELETSALGNELLLATHQLNADGSRVANAVEQAGGIREIQSIGGTNTTTRFHTVNNFVTGIAVGDIRAPGDPVGPAGGPDDVLHFGSDNGGLLRTNRNSWQAFTRDPGPGGFPNFNFVNFNAANQGSAILDGVIGNVLAGALGTAADDPTAPDIRNELVSVGKQLNGTGASAAPNGNGVIEISNTFSGGCCLQQIVVTGQELTSVVLADVLDSDGVKEIVAGSSTGFVHVFRHTTPGDLSTLFDASPALSLNIGSNVIELAVEYTGRVVPEPSAGLLLLLGGCITLGLRRRS